MYKEKESAISRFSESDSPTGGAVEIPLVSVIMNCLNCEQYVREAVDSVYAQTYPNWEIIFWDNASTDRSPEIARAYNGRLRYFRGKETIPLYAARNMALKKARGNFIAFLDCDDLWLPEKLEKQIPLFNDPDVGLVFSDAIYLHEKGRSKRLYAGRPYYSGRCFKSMLYDYFLCLPTVILRRAALGDMKEWFDPRFNIAGDGDLFQRLSYEWKLSMVNEPLAKYRAYSSSFARTKAQLLAKELEIILEKYEKLFPGFNSRFEAEIRSLKRRISINKALAFVDSGERAKAIRCLIPYVFTSVKAMGLFVLAFAPKEMFDAVYKSRDRLKPC